MLKVGDKAPDFEVVVQDGSKLSLFGFRGKKIILYFYPKDNTPGCIAEACNLRDNYDLMLKNGFVVIGVSADSEKSHQRFTKKYQLPFLLIADTEKEIIKAYGVWGSKKFMGREYEGILRSTFVISEDGIIDEVISKVKTKAHAEQILEEVKLNTK